MVTLGEDGVGDVKVLSGPGGPRDRESHHE